MPNSEVLTKLIHPLLIFGSSVSYALYFVLTLISFNQAVFPPLWLTVSFLALTSFSAIFFGIQARDQRRGLTARLRELIVVAVLAYLIASISLWPALADLFRPNLTNVAFTLLIIFQWFISLYLQQVLRTREEYLLAIREAEAEALRNIIRESFTLSQDSIKGLQRVVWITQGLAAVSVFLKIITSYLSYQTLFFADCLLYLGLIIPFIARLILFELSNEQLLAGEGLVMTGFIKRQRLISGLLIISLAFILAFSLSADQSLLPLDWIIRLLDWIKSLFKHKPINQLPSQPVITELLPPPLELLPGDIEPLVKFDFERLWRILRQLAIVSGLILLIYFVIKPLLSKAFYRRLRHWSLKVFLKNCLANIRRLLVWLKPPKDQIPASDINNLTAVKAKLQSLAKLKKTRQKQREIGFMVRQFLSLIKWGTSQQRPYQTFMTPMEYVKTLTTIQDCQATDCLLIGELFEEAIYSADPLPARKAALYRTKIKQVIEMTSNF